MEMFKRVHEKFTLHYSPVLPPVGGKNATTLDAFIAFVNELRSLLFFNIMFHFINRISFDEQDTGISVRKRVIKILRDICLEQPTFSKITEMCVKMIRRVNDEEGIKVWISLQI